MNVSDAELRQLIRDAIASRASRVADGVKTAPRHPSHARLPLARGVDGEGACLIEPAVRCNHCGYCLSFGH
jgi:hypothetical protein